MQQFVESLLDKDKSLTYKCIRERVRDEFLNREPDGCERKLISNTIITTRETTTLLRERLADSTKLGLLKESKLHTEYSILYVLTTKLQQTVCDSLYAPHLQKTIRLDPCAVLLTSKH